MSRMSESTGIERDMTTFHEVINKNQAVCISETQSIHIPTCEMDRINFILQTNKRVQEVHVIMRKQRWVGFKLKSV